jgi:hypothetical protein
MDDEPGTRPDVLVGHQLHSTPAAVIHLYLLDLSRVFVANSDRCLTISPDK